MIENAIDTALMLNPLYAAGLWVSYFNTHANQKIKIVAIATSVFSTLTATALASITLASLKAKTIVVLSTALLTTPVFATIYVACSLLITRGLYGGRM